MTSKLSEPLREGAPVLDQCGVERVVGVSMIDNSLFSDLLFTTASNVSCLQPIMESDFLISLFILFMSLGPMLLPQQMAEENRALATTDW